MQLHQYALWRDEAARGSGGVQLPQALLRCAHEAFEEMQVAAAEEGNDGQTPMRAPPFMTPPPRAPRRQ